MPKVAPDTLRGRFVQFRIRDIYLPQPYAILDELHGGEVLEGKVVEVSDGGSDGSTFVVIEVDGLRQPCIVSAERILGAR
jgi:hypothetical protein